VSIYLRQVDAGVSKKERARPWVGILPEIEREMQSSSVAGIACVSSVQSKGVFFPLAGY